MLTETTEQTLTKLLDKGDKKSLGNLLIYLIERWEEEKHYEDFSDYAKYMKNVLHKVTPKRTKFVSLTHDLDNDNTIQLHLTTRLHSHENELKISVSKATLTWCLLGC